MIKQTTIIVFIFLGATIGCRTGEGAKHQKRHGSARPTEGAIHSDSSKEWLVGRWEWRSKSRTNVRFPVLECLAQLRVYPYLDFDAESVRIGEAYIPAEFVTRDCDGNEGVLPDAVPVLMKGDAFLFAGLNSGWLFSYRHWQTNGTHWLALNLVPDTGNWSFSILLEKESDDAGQPIDRTRLFSAFPYSDDPGKLESDYRQRKGLK